MNLLSNTNFGNHLKTLEISNSCYKMLRINFDSFVSKKLELGMFVPCDEEGNVLEEFDYLVDIDKHTKWFKAKERCLFEGCVYDDKMDAVRNENGLMMFSEKYKHESNHTIEYLVKYNLTLTKTAQKLIGL